MPGRSTRPSPPGVPASAHPTHRHNTSSGHRGISRSPRWLVRIASCKIETSDHPETPISLEANALPRLLPALCSFSSALRESDAPDRPWPRPARRLQNAGPWNLSPVPQLRKNKPPPVRSFPALCQFSQHVLDRILLRVHKPLKMKPIASTHARPHLPRRPPLVQIHPFCQRKFR
jgi:hypothetical protein